MSAARYDLHTHTIASDGTLSPAELVGRARGQGVGVLAVTDHDTTEGLAAAKAAASEAGLVLINGVEASVTWGGRTIHVVGLGIDPQNAALQAGLEGLRDFRAWRAEEIARRLAAHGIPEALEGARRYALGTIVSRTHFARYIVERGAARDVREVFHRFLVNGKPGHVPGQWASLEQAVTWIRSAGGQAVIAHPARYKLTRTRLRRLLGEFMELGGEAIEVVSGSHSADECRTMAAHARSCGLLASSGSDYHGPENPWVELGRTLPLPEGCTPVWEVWRH